MSLIAIFVALVFLHSLVSARLVLTVVTAPIVFTGVGIAVLLGAPNLPGRGTALDLSRWRPSSSFPRLERNGSSRSPTTR